MKKLILYSFIILAASCNREEPPPPSAPPPTTQNTPGDNYFTLDADTFWCDEFNAYREGNDTTTLIQVDTTTYGGAILYVLATGVDSVRINGSGGSTIQETNAGAYYENIYTDVIITNYGNVGQLIEGRYSGVWRDEQNISIQKQVSGVFSIIRTADH